MYINSVGSIPSFGNQRILRQAKKIVDKTMHTKTHLTVSKNGFCTGLKITIPGREGSIIVNGSTNPLTLAQDFAKVQKARQLGILKPEHVTKIGL